MNSVIIPEENVRIRISGIHLLFKLLWIKGVTRIDVTISEVAIEIGLIDDTVTMIVSVSAVIMSLSSFDLQNQCSVLNFVGVSYYFFFLVFLVGFFVMFFYHYHYMIVLVGLEMVLLSVFVFFCYSLACPLVSWVCFVFILVLVCMGGFGVSLLVGLSRVVGKDFWSVGFFL
jgi:hypothetical protein